MRSWARWIVGLTGVLAGCPAPGSSGPGVEVLDPGRGEPATEPPFPLVTGARRELDRRPVTAMLGPDERFGVTVQRFQGGEENRYFREEPGGLSYLGAPRFGELSPPILLIPRELRDGMRWVVRGADGEGVGTFAAERVEEPSMFGPLPRWRVTQTHAVTGNVFTTDYVEGRGPLQAGGTVSELRGNVRVVYLPLEDRGRSASPAPRVLLSPLGAGLVDEDTWGRTLSLVESPDGSTSVRIGGRYAYLDSSSGTPSYRLGSVVVCVRLEGGALGTVERFTDPDDTTLGSSAPCPDARGALLDASGTVRSWPTGYDGRALAGLGAPFLDAASRVRAIGVVTDPWGEPYVAVADPDADPYLAPGAQLDAPFRVQTPRVTRTDVTTVLADARGPSDERTVAVLLDDRVLSARMEAGALVGTARLVASIPGGSVHARLDASGRGHFVTWSDGWLDRIVLDDAGVRLERVARLELPEAHELVGALPWSEGLLVVTAEGREDFRGGLVRPELGRLFAWTAPRPTTSTPSPTMDGEHNVIATPMGDDLRVCWTGEAAASGLAGARLGGAAARHVHAIDVGGMRCAIVLRDGAPDPSRLDAWLFEAELPELGPFVVAIDPSVVPDRRPALPELLDRVIAPLRGGGFVSASFLYGDDLAPSGVPPAALRPQNAMLDLGVADAAGHGLWRQGGLDLTSECPDGVGPCRRLERFGREHHEAFVAGAGMGVLPELLAPAEGGGVLWRATRAQRVTADGTVHELPASAEGLTSYCGMLANGTACGVRTRRLGPGVSETDLFCRDPDGTERASLLADPGAVPDRPWLAARGQLYAHQYVNDDTGSYQRIVRVDPAALTLHEVLRTEDTLLTPAYAADGALLFTQADRTSGVLEAILEIRGEEAVSLLLPAYVLDAAFVLPRLHAGEALFVLEDGTRLLRFPRPSAPSP